MENEVWIGEGNRESLAMLVRDQLDKGFAFQELHMRTALCKLQDVNNRHINNDEASAIISLLMDWVGSASGNGTECVFPIEYKRTSLKYHQHQTFAPEYPA